MDVLKTYKKLEKWPMGKWLYSRVVSMRAPYFSTIKPYLKELENGHAVATMKHRRSVHNHIKTVHAIAVCNLCEFAMGLAVLATMPKNMRFLPKSMDIHYDKKAIGTLTATATYAESEFKIGDNVVPVIVTNEQKEVITRAYITIYVTEGKQTF